MEEDILSTNLLSIAAAGLLLFLSGLGLYVFRDHFAGSSRFLMPIPPLVVAAYIFVFNLYRHYGGSAPPARDAAREIALSTAVAAVAFSVFTVLLVLIIDAVKR
jgi:hypothetical protein